MSYKVNRSLGYQPWGVTNPWVFADLSQPQRKRGRVSPMVFQTAGPFLKSAHLGAADEPAVSPEQEAEIEKLRQAVEEQARADQQHIIAWTSLAFSAAALLLSYEKFRRRKMQPNRKRRRRRRRRKS